MTFDSDKEERLSAMAEVSREIVLSEFPTAVERIQKAAEESLVVARSARARVRRQRMVSRSQTNLPAYRPQEAKLAEAEELKMPAEWRDDEDTRQFKVEKKP